MNKLFLYLIVIGILVLVSVAGWEFYQISSGARSTFEYTVIEIKNPVLIPKNLEEHLKNDPSYSNSTNENDEFIDQVLR